MAERSLRQWAAGNMRVACEKLVHVVDTVEPDPVLVEKYEARYQEFRKLYPAVKALFPFT